MSVENSPILRTLGKTNIQITAIGLGTMEFSGGGRGMISSAFPKLGQDEKNAIVKAALEGGINWFDTAELYGGGFSEATLTTALKSAGKNDQDVVVATKWWPIFRTARNIARTIADRIQCLDGYTIGLYMVHQPFSFSSVEAEMAAMADLVEAGKIRSVGVSNFNARQMRRAHQALKARGLSLAANQVLYSLLNRSIEKNGILDTAKELGITIIAYTPLASGLLTGKFHQQPELMQAKPWFYRANLRRGLDRSRPLVATLAELGGKYQATPAQVALNWVIHAHGETIVTIPGATKVRHAQESATAMRFRLSADEITQLNELSRS
jgi:aryl-alcohol dehydrogenase-like predicted oxidoreductase